MPWGGALGDGAEVGGCRRESSWERRLHLGYLLQILAFTFLSRFTFYERGRHLRVIILWETQITALKKDFLFETPTIR